MIKVLVSSCLLGERVRYHGGDATCASSVLARWEGEGRLVPFCPEVAGGLPVPRPAAESVGGDGRAVLEGSAVVLDATGKDVTQHVVAGAREALETAMRNGVKAAVLKEGSPSCASGSVYDGSFSGVRKQGQGVAAALLSQAGIRVFSEQDIEAAEAYVAGLENA